MTSRGCPVDNTNITERVRAIQARTNPRPFILETEWGLFLATSLIAIGRARRGDILQQPVEEAARALLVFVVTLDILNVELLLQANVVRERLGWGIISL